MLFVLISKSLQVLKKYVSILFQILKKAVFGVPILTWYDSYLSCKHQWIKLNEHKSDFSYFPFRFPRGHLSPFIFALFTNGIKQIIPNCNILSFANDLKIFRQLTNDSDCLLLQDELKI